MKNTTENNKLIAEFMPNWDGRFYHMPSAGKYTALQLKFHSDWNWLMPVVEKIYNTDLYYKKYIDYNSSMFTDGEIKLTTQINTVYDQVTEFIKWHNLNN